MTIDYYHWWFSNPGPIQWVVYSNPVFHFLHLPSGSPDFWTTVDRSNPANQLRLVVDPVIYRVLYIPGGAGFQPSTVSTVSWITGWGICEQYIAWLPNFARAATRQELYQRPEMPSLCWMNSVGDPTNMITEQRLKPLADIPLYWLVYRDPYHGIW